MKILVLGGGPDAERDVSVQSATAVHDALRKAGHDADLRIISGITEEELAAIPGDVIFPALHGPWGEGGPLQDILEADGRPYVGARPRPARLAMDKAATKAVAIALGIRTPDFAILSPADNGCPFPLPVVLKPIHEGSTIGLHVCNTDADWTAAIEDARAKPRPRIIERAIRGRECTVGLLDNQPLPTIEIIPAGDLYDYEAKYNRDDTRYVPNPDIPADAEREMQDAAVKLAEALGVRHIARVDFILDAEDRPWLLELNTMPGFTSHSLVPMAARARETDPLEMSALCAHLVELAARDAEHPHASSRMEAGANT